MQCCFLFYSAIEYQEIFIKVEKCLTKLHHDLLTFLVLWNVFVILDQNLMVVIVHEQVENSVFHQQALHFPQAELVQRVVDLLSQLISLVSGLFSQALSGRSELHSRC